MRRVQYSLRSLLIVVTVAAVLCSLVKVASYFIPVDFLLILGQYMALTAAISALPAALIGRRIGRMFGSVYLGITWGVIFALLLVVLEIVCEFNVVSSPFRGAHFAVTAVGAFVGGCFGGIVMWSIKKSHQRIVRDGSRSDEEKD
jgi:hypothetical protein